MVNNLDIYSLETINNGNDLRVIARYERLKAKSISSERFERLIHDINLVLKTAASNRSTVSFWGAGHRSLTLISQLQHHLISQIVDSAPFKHGKYCPDTGLAIVSPTQFFEQPTDILFLSLPGIYADEVIRQIKSANLQIKQVILIEGNHIKLLHVD